MEALEARWLAQYAHCLLERVLSASERLSRHSLLVTTPYELLQGLVVDRGAVWRAAVPVDPVVLDAPSRSARALGGQPLEGVSRSALDVLAAREEGGARRVLRQTEGDERAELLRILWAQSELPPEVFRLAQ